MTRCAGLQYENKAMVDFLTYDNSAYGIKIKYPSNWSFEYGVNPVCDTVIDIVGIYPPIAIDSNIITYLQVGIGCKITTIDLLARNAINGWRANQDFELVSANAQTNLAGRPGYAIVFKHCNLEQYLTTRVYYIIFTTEAARYDAFLPLVQTMINSLEFTALEREGIMKN
jgi:eukaryotic-like serine/threonine-protein kinase